MKYTLSLLVSWSNWRVTLRLDAFVQRSVHHGRLVIGIQVASLETTTVVLKHNRMISWTFVSQAHLLHFICVVPEHITVVSNESFVIVKLLMSLLLQLLLGLWKTRHWFGARHADRWSPEILWVCLVALVKENAVYLLVTLKLDLVIEFINGVTVEILIRNRFFRRNNFTVDIERSHIMRQIDLRVLHFSKLTLGLISVPWWVPIVHGHIRI